MVLSANKKWLIFGVTGTGIALVGGGLIYKFSGDKNSDEIASDNTDLKKQSQLRQQGQGNDDNLPLNQFELQKDTDSPKDLPENDKGKDQKEGKNAEEI